MNQYTNLLQRVKSYVKVFLGLPLTLISLFFIFKIIYQYKDIIFSNFSHLNFPVFLLGIISIMLYFLIRGIAWTELLKKQGFSINRPSSIYFFSLSEVQRYIPANIFSFIARINYFNKYKVPNKITLKLLFIEFILLILSGLAFSIFSFPILREIFEDLKNLVISRVNNYFLLTILLCITLSILFILKKIKFNFNFKFKDLLKYIDVFTLLMLGWVSFGVGNYFIASSFISFDPKFFLELSSFFVASLIIGYIVLIAPVGLGVRELVIAFGLSSFIPLYFSSSLSIVLRVSLIFSEILFLISIYFWNRLNFYSNFKKGIKFDNQRIILIISTFLYILYFSYASFEKHLNFFTGRFDLGNMDQTVWNTINGRIFMLTDPDKTNIISRLGIHSDFILILLSPFYLVWNDPRMLLLIQTIVIGIGGIFVYLIAEKVLNDSKVAFKNSSIIKNLALALSISYFLNPFIQKQNLFDFHGVTLATTFILASFYYLLKNKYIPFFIFLFLAVLTKEQIFLIAGIFGLFIAFKKKRKFGIAITVVSFLAFYLLISKFIPEARDTTKHFALQYLNDFGDYPIEIIKNITFQPSKMLSYLFTSVNFEYFQKLTISTGFLSIFSPFYLIFSLPDLIINLLSNNQGFKSIEYHYSAAIIPSIYISSIYGIKKLLSFNFKILNPKVIFYYLILFSLFSTWLYGVLPGSNRASLEIFTRKLPERDRIENFLQKIPPDLSVAATNNLGAHLSHREYIYTVPVGIDKADVVLFLLNDSFARPSLKEQKRMVKEMRNDKNYIQIFKTGDFIVFEKGNLQTAKKISYTKSDLFPYNILTLQDRDYQEDEVVIEKLLHENDFFKSYLISYLSDGLRLYSLMNIPNVEKPKNGYPIVIINHDFEDKKTYNNVEAEKEIADYFSSRGYLVIKPDYRGYGESETDDEPLDRFAYSTDVLNLIYSINSIDQADKTQIYLIGRGLGGEVVLKTLEIITKNDKLNKNIKAALVISPLVDLISFYTDSNVKNEDTLNTKKIYKEIGKPQESIQQWLTLSPLSYANQILSPILIFHGEEDNEVKVSDSYKLFEILSLSSVNSNLITFTTEGHDISENKFKEILEKSLTFFESYK